MLQLQSQFYTYDLVEEVDFTPPDVNQRYTIDDYFSDTNLTLLHKLVFFPEKLQEYLHQAKLGSQIGKYNIQLDSLTLEQEFSPLVLAVENDIVESVELLLQYGANVNLINKYNNSVLLFVHSEPNKIFKLLLEYEADINHQNNSGSTVISYFGWNVKYNKISLQYNYNKQLVGFSKSILNSVYIQLSNINSSKIEQYDEDYRNVNKQLRKLKKFDYNSILLFELKKCVF